LFIGVLQGRINPDVLHAVFDGTWSTGIGDANESLRDGVRFLTVGTKAMMSEADGWLKRIGYPMQQHALLR